jgi:hypothetical protein
MEEARVGAIAQRYGVRLPNAVAQSPRSGRTDRASDKLGEKIRLTFQQG